MIFIAVKFSLRPDVADQWLARVAPFTAATRAEPGNLFFEWSRSVDTPNQRTWRIHGRPSWRISVLAQAWSGGGAVSGVEPGRHTRRNVTEARA
jgi:hypothetical protein